MIFVSETSAIERCFSMLPLKHFWPANLYYNCTYNIQECIISVYIQTHIETEGKHWQWNIMFQYNWIDKQQVSIYNFYTHLSVIDVTQTLYKPIHHASLSLYQSLKQMRTAHMETNAYTHASSAVLNAAQYTGILIKQRYKISKLSHLPKPPIP